MKSKLSFFGRLIILAILFFLFVVMIQVNMQINDKEKEYERVAGELSKQKEAIAKVEDELNAPFSEETIRKIAREDLGLCNPGDIIYESDSPN